MIKTKIIFIDGIIYIISNDINDKKYIGQTKSHLISPTTNKSRPYGIQSRLRDHITKAYSKKPTCPKLSNAIRKYGAEHFYIEELENCDLESLDCKESYYINKYDSIKNGYNICLGGKINFTEEEKLRIYKKVSAANKREWANEDKREIRIESMRKNSYKTSEKLQQKWKNDSKFRKRMTKLSNDKWKSMDRRNSMAKHKRLKHNIDLPTGMSKYYNANNEHTGYRCHITINMNIYQKCFTSLTFTVEENFLKSVEWLENIKKEHNLT